MASKGYNLVLASRNLYPLEEIKKNLIDLYPVCVEVIQSDLSQKEGPRNLWNECESRSYCIDILFNNAGVGLFGECSELDSEEIEAMLFLKIQALMLVEILTASAIHIFFQGPL